MADKVELAAMKGERMPGGLNAFDQIRFHGLSYIYANYRNGVTNKETASAYKQSLLKEIKLLKDDYAFGIKCFDHAAERYKKTESALSSYVLDRTIENADILAAAVDGLERLG